MAIYDNYNIRFNTANNTLEMNTGNETWIPVPGAGGSEITSLTGDVTATGPGASASTVVLVGGVTAARLANTVTVGTLAGTGTITPVATTASTFTMTVTGNVTLNGPSSPVNGQKVIFRILNDGVSTVTLATGAGNFRFGTDITAYTNSVSLTDYVGAIYNSPATRWDVVSVIQGF